MATILDNVKRKKDEFKKNPLLAGQNMGLAIAAMREGVNSRSWEFYMTQFARDENGALDKDQLARLMGNDNTLGDLVLDRKRGYLIANALCGMSTIETLTFGVESIDNNIGKHVCDLAGPSCETGIVLPKAPRKRVAKKKAAKK